MASTFVSELYEKALGLPDEDRRELAHLLLAHDGIDDDMDDAWVEKMRRRIADVEEGRAKTYSLAEAKERVRTHVAKRRG